MILNDATIERLCIDKQLVTPYDPLMLNPSSIDIRIGNSMKLRQQTYYYDQSGDTFPLGLDWVDIDLSKTTIDKPYWVNEGSIFLVSTLEKFNIPDNLCGQIYLKSSRARELIEHLHATFIDAGYNNSHLTLELKNEDYEPKKIYRGLRIAQIAFQQMTGPAHTSYAVTGNYNNAETVQTSMRSHETSTVNAPPEPKRATGERQPT